MKDNNHEISLSEIVDFFRESWKKILLGGLVGGMLGASYALITPPLYQATANIQVAKVANAEIELPTTLVAKMRMPTYYSSNTFIECGLKDLAEPGIAIINKLNPALAINAPIVTITYESNSPEVTKKCLESVLADIRKDQDEILLPIVKIKKNQLNNLKVKLEVAEHLLNSLPSNKLNFDFSDPKFSASVLLFTTYINKVNEINDLMTQISDLEIALSEPQTKSTSLVGPIYSPNLRIKSGKPFNVLSASIAGIILVMVFLLSRKTSANI